VSLNGSVISHATFIFSESVCFWGELLEVFVPLRYALPMDPSCNLPNVYQFRVVVQGISPLIWRRLLVRSDMSLAILHATLQIMFAWGDTYLHSFHIHGKAYGTPRLDSPHLDIEASHVPLATLRLHRGERFSYVYDSSLTGSVTSDSKRPCRSSPVVSIPSAQVANAPPRPRTVAEHRRI
jgi:hypothetical protein